MLERFIKLSEFVAPILIKHPRSPPFLSATDIEIVNDLIQILQPLEEATRDICGNKYLTASKIIPLIHCLKNNLTDKIIPATEQGELMKQSQKLTRDLEK